MDGESGELTDWENVVGAWTGKSKTEGPEWGWRRELGSWFQRHGEAYLKKRWVIRNEDDVGGRARVTRDEERVLRGGWTKMRLRSRYAWVVVSLFHIFTIRQAKNFWTPFWKYRKKSPYLRNGLTDCHEILHNDLLWTHLDNPRRVFGGLYYCTKFHGNRCSSFDNMQVLIFIVFGLKMSIHSPNCFFGRFYYINAEQSHRDS